MYQQTETDLGAVFRDTSGHRFSVLLHLMLAVISFLALTLFHVMTNFNWILFGLIFYGIPVHLLLSALRQTVSHAQAKARLRDGYSTLAPLKSSRKMTIAVFGIAVLIAAFMMQSPTPLRDINSAGPNWQMVTGVLIFCGLWGYKIYLAIWRPSVQPDLAPSRQAAISSGRQIMARSFRGAATRLIFTLLIIGVFGFYFIYVADFGYGRIDNLL
tara:strand:- start:715 stop:1356 length:642 start_codon:yes stop_codon:yes gene_type:complete